MSPHILLRKARSRAMARGETLALRIALWLIISAGSAAVTDPGDAAAMATIAKSITPLPLKWSTDPALDPCGDRWQGVSCTSGKVISIDLQGIFLKGSLAPEIANLTSLQSLALQRNELTGDLPSLAGLSTLREIYLGSNTFRSIPATFFSGLISLVNVSLDHNPFSPWIIPLDLAQCGNLGYFSAMNASISGPIPDIFADLSSLKVLRLSYNFLSGFLPPSLGSPPIVELYLNNQNSNSTSAPGKLFGPLTVLSSMADLQIAWVHGNSFSGIIPDLSKCTSLFDLQLRENELTGPLPPSLLSLSSLKNLTLSNNLLQGPFPDLGNRIATDAMSGNSFCKQIPGPCDQRVTDLLEIAGGFGYPAIIARAWKGNNPCSAWLFVSCDPQGNITTLNFADQKLTGRISPAISRFAALRFLKLQNNNLTGTIPPALASLPHLQSVDLSNNNFSGQVPVFAASVTVITAGNPFIGKDVPDSGSGGGDGSSSPSGSSDGSSSLSAGIIALIVLFTLLAVAGSVFLFLWKRRNRPKRFGKVEIHSPPNGSETKFQFPPPTEAGSFSRTDQPAASNSHMIENDGLYIPIQELLRATKNFSEENILGSGGFGVVYKGVQPDGTLIAVKRMECMDVSQKGMGEFKAEIEVLKKVRHRNLVALLGYCEHGNEKLLVYEYMPQGTLSQHLFGQVNGQTLTWKQRLVIALDVARGLEYLHNLAQLSFIHRDLKPSNILLDEGLRGKVSDFGLVKLAPDGKHSVQTRLAGTFGYLAPEYATTGRVTTKVDVYAYGVVLMELLTGRKALDETLPDELTHLVSWFRRVLISRDNNSNLDNRSNRNNGLLKAADPRFELADQDVPGFVAVAELAGHCTSREPHQRPDMGHAVNVLVPLVGLWRPVNGSDEDEEDSASGSMFHGSLPQRLRRWQMNEGTTSLSGFDLNSSMDVSHGSIPAKPDMYPDGR